MSSLLDAVLSGARTETGLVNAISVLLPLLNSASAAGEPAPADSESCCVSAAVAAVLGRLPALHGALVAPPSRPDLVTSWGRLSPPLGATRPQLARLIAALLATGRPAVHAQLAALGTVDVLLVRSGGGTGGGSGWHCKRGPHRSELSGTQTGTLSGNWEGVVAATCSLFSLTIVFNDKIMHTLMVLLMLPTGNEGSQIVIVLFVYFFFSVRICFSTSP